MTIFDLALRSLWNRRSTVLLILATIAISTALLLGVQLLRTSAREGFTQTVSGVDLIVGARSGPVNLLLYSVFGIGDATSNVSWETYQKIAQHRDVAWTVPLALGDSHRGYRVLGTNTDYFRHYRFAGDRRFQFAAGSQFSELGDVVLGADVARDLQYELGDRLVIAHGLGEVSFMPHEQVPFRVSGILERTGLNERRRELAILRSVGARPRHILTLILIEAGLVTSSGVLVGVLLTYAGLIIGRPLLQDHLGVFIPIQALSWSQVTLLAGIIGSGLLIGWIPARRAYKTTLDDGLQIRV